MWTIIAVFLLLFLIAIFLLAAKAWPKPTPMHAGLVAGSVVGALAAIVSTEFLGFGYPIAIILMLLGASFGQAIGYVVQERY